MSTPGSIKIWLSRWALRGEPSSSPFAPNGVAAWLLTWLALVLACFTVVLYSLAPCRETFETITITTKATNATNATNATYSYANFTNATNGTLQQRDHPQAQVQALVLEGAKKTTRRNSTPI